MPTDKIPFNQPAITGKEAAFVRQAAKRGRLTTDKFVTACKSWFGQEYPDAENFLTPSCTHALEMAVILLEIKPGDEVILPSFTYVSAANSVALRGGVPVFVDLRPDTMNIDENLIEPAITAKTRAIMVMHYGGISCNMEAIMHIAKHHNIPVIEDAAHALGASWKGKKLGTFGAMATFSFHQTKNITAGQGGALLVNDKKYCQRADILQHKGTNYTAFMQGDLPCYTWIDLGSSWCLNELNAAYLYGNLLAAQKITRRRHQLWKLYREGLQRLADNKSIELPQFSDEHKHNAHIFYIKVKDGDERSAFLSFMQQQQIFAVFHYIPLHSSPAGEKYGRFSGQDSFTTKESERLARLPLFYNMTERQVQKVMAAIYRFYEHGKH